LHTITTKYHTRSTLVQSEPVGQASNQTARNEQPSLNTNHDRIERNEYETPDVNHISDSQPSVWSAVLLGVTCDATGYLAQHAVLVVPLRLEPLYLVLKGLNVRLRLLDGAFPPRLALPSLDFRHFFFNGSVLGFDLRALAAFRRDVVGVHDEFHATSFTGAVFSGAVLTEVSPFVAVTSLANLSVEAHLVGAGVDAFGLSVLGMARPHLKQNPRNEGKLTGYLPMLSWSEVYDKGYCRG
jgi:hypothetical protein